MRNLVICPIGDSSVHRTWLDEPAERNFDLMLIYFGNGPDAARNDAQYYLRRQGFKYEHLAHVGQTLREVLQRYEYLWCPDDDIAVGTRGVREIFDICAAYQLQLAQPALAAGEVSYQALRQKPGMFLRYSPFVEVMCPVFSRAAFFRAAVLFTENRSGWGIDWVWSKWWPLHQMAIIDKVGVHHTRPLMSGEHYQRLAAQGIDPFRDFRETTDRHGGIDWGVHHRFVNGRIKLRGIAAPQAPGTFLSRWWARMRGTAA